VQGWVSQLHEALQYCCTLPQAGVPGTHSWPVSRLWPALHSGHCERSSNSSQPQPSLRQRRTWRAVAPQVLGPHEVVLTSSWPGVQASGRGLHAEGACQLHDDEQVMLAWPH
jgi:hypothetical protein